MTLKDYPGLDETIKRFDAWFACEVHDRPPVTMPAIWREMTVPMPAKTWRDAREERLDVEFRIELFEARLPFMRFIGDSYPVFNHSVGADLVATLFGAGLAFNERSVWAVHNLENIRDVLSREPHFGNPYWQATRRMTELSLERSEGRWLTPMAYIDPGGDSLVALRGPQKLCLDLVDDLEGVRLACEHVSGFYPAIYDDLHARIRAAGQPTPVGGEGVTGYGRIDRLGCDLLALISAPMAEAAVYPSLQARMRWLDRGYFHLDSPGSLQHLDMLLGQEELGGVQFVYGAGRGPAARWIDVYRRIQAAGKCLELLPESTADALAVMEHLKPEGVWFKFYPGVPEEEAHWFVRQVAEPGNWA